jgi:hypothetical protein
MSNRKAIVALIGNNIYIDPSDVKRVDIAKVKAEAYKTVGKEIGVKILPLQLWMPSSGAEAITKEVLKDLGINQKNNGKKRF